MNTRRMTLALLALLAFSSALFVRAQESDNNAITVRVDPRVELFSIIFRLAGNPEYNRGRVPAYIDAVEAHFGEHRNHTAIRAAQQLRAARGVSYDAVMSMAIHLTDASDMQELTSFDGEHCALDARWNRSEARIFLEKARDFARDTDFAGFFEAQRPFYDLVEERMRAMVDAHADLEWFDAFFGAKPDADFTVAIGLLNGGGNYGPKVVFPDGRESLYAIMGVWLLNEAQQPMFDARVLPTLVHEFCHSYANQLIERHLEELQPAGEAIYPFVAEAMKRQAYGNWETMLKESLVRASVARYVLDHEGADAAQREVAEQEEERRFLWTGGLFKLLGEYEANREQYPDLASFMPRIIAFFNGTAKSIRADLAAREAAIAASRPKVVSMTPVNGANDVDHETQAIVITFDRPMRTGGWSVMFAPDDTDRTMFPVVHRCAYDETGRIFTMTVTLEPGKQYAFTLNGEGGGAFRSHSGNVPLEMVRVTFTTRAIE